jgi:vitamin B12 transporter
LTPEDTKSFDVTVEYKDLKVTYFDTKIDDMIDFDMATYTYTNIAGTSNINGLEIFYKQSFLDSFMLSMNYTHLFNAEDENEEELKRRAKDSFKIAVDYYGIENLHLGVDAQYVGSRIDIKYNPDWTTSDVQTGKYTVVNLTANYDITKEVQVYGKIENLTDEYYQTVYGYATSPRAFYLGLKANF